MRLEPCADVIGSAAARRSILIGGGGVGGEIELFRILVSKTFQQRTSVIKVCMLNHYFFCCLASNSKKLYYKNRPSVSEGGKTKQAEVQIPSSSTNN